MIETNQVPFNIPLICALFLKSSIFPMFYSINLISLFILRALNFHLQQSLDKSSCSLIL